MNVIISSISGFVQFSSGSHHQPLITDLIEEALTIAASSEHDSRQGMPENSDMDPLLDRFRKASNSRPKYDPGLKWMGLGKRPAATQPLGPKIFPDLRHFFDAARDQLLDQYRNGNVEAGAPVESKVPPIFRNENDALKFVQRSKESGETAPRKTHYNPSLYWTGLGR